MARKNDGASANPNTLTAAPSDRKIRQVRVEPRQDSDVTDGGLYLSVTPDNSRPGYATTKLWRMGYRFHKFVF